MNSETPFFRGLFQVDLLAASEALASAYQDDGNGVLTALSFAVPTGNWQKLEGSETLPPGFFVASSSYVFIVMTGTQNSTQAILQIVGSSQVAVPGIPGKVGQFHSTAASVMYAQALPIMQGMAPLSRVVLLGHSLGGAMAEIMIPLIQAAFPGVPLSCFTFGAPRTGDAVFAAAVGPNVYRVEDTSDPIPSIPPPVWAGPGSAWPVSGPAPYDLWEHPGTAITLDEQGTITDGSDPPSTLTAAFLLATGQVGSHQMTEYARRLNAKLPPEQLSVLLGEDMAAPASAASTPTVYKVYLAYNYGQAGISEEWYSTLDVATLRATTIPGYLAVRMALAVSQFEFVYARISNPQSPRWVDFLTANDPGVTRFGTIGSNIKNAELPAAGAEDDGALLSRMKLVGGPSARQFLHAFDQTQTNEGQFTPNGTWTRAYKAYQNFLIKTGNGVMFAFQNKPTGKLNITGITAKMPRGFTVTPAVAFTGQVGDRVYIGGVGRGLVGAKGKKIVTGFPTGGATFDVGGASPVGALTGTGAFYYNANPTQAFVQYMQVERLTSHRVGRPFAEPRGRKSALLSLRLSIRAASRWTFSAVASSNGCGGMRRRRWALG